MFRGGPATPEETETRRRPTRWRRTSADAARPRRRSRRSWRPGARSALPHARPMAEVCLADADFLLIDWGATVGGYRSDLTRMLVTGKVGPEFARVYRARLGRSGSGPSPPIRPGREGRRRRRRGPFRDRGGRLRRSIRSWPGSRARPGDPRIPLVPPAFRRRPPTRHDLHRRTRHLPPRLGRHPHRGRRPRHAGRRATSSRVSPAQVLESLSSLLIYSLLQLEFIPNLKSEISNPSTSSSFHPPTDPRPHRRNASPSEGRRRLPR